MCDSCQPPPPSIPFIRTFKRINLATLDLTNRTCILPNHDYECRPCRVVLRDQYRSVSVGGRDTRPACPDCGRIMDWVIPRLRLDLRADGEGTSGATFQKFTIRDGQNNLVEIDSLHKLRQVERESEKMAADGIGQPIRFRAFAQDHSNMSVNTFGEGPSEKPSAAGKRKFGLRGGATPVDAPAEGGDPDYTYGPGVNDSNTSALEVD